MDGAGRVIDDGGSTRCTATSAPRGWHRALASADDMRKCSAGHGHRVRLTCDQPGATTARAVARASRPDSMRPRAHTVTALPGPGAWSASPPRRHRRCREWRRSATIGAAGGMPWRLRLRLDGLAGIASDPVRAVGRDCGRLTTPTREWAYRPSRGDCRRPDDSAHGPVPSLTPSWCVGVGSCRVRSARRHAARRSRHCRPECVRLGGAASRRRRTVAGSPRCGRPRAWGRPSAAG